jgi:hypothetical protein
VTPIFRKICLVVLALVLGPLVMICGARRDGIARDEDVLLFTTSGSLDTAGQIWQIPLHGWIFERETDSWWRAALQKGVLDLLELDPADRHSEILRRRLEMFLVDNESGKTLSVILNGQPYPVGPSGANGHLEGQAEVAARALKPVAGSRIQSAKAVMAAADGRRFECRIQLPGVHGLSVISDIDDTIKISQVLDKEALLANTFLREFEPLPDMASVYRRWAARGAAFHYVSASPWQLYPALNRFIEKAGFPSGEIQLRYLRVKDRSFFAFMRASRAFKTRTIEALFRRYPKRKFILVGDSGENDPAIYAAVARAHPQNVSKIYIHLVSPDPGHRESVADLFRDLPRSCWDLFNTGAQLDNFATMRPPEPH